MLNGFGETQRKLLEELLNNKDGMTIDNICKSLNISRTAVNQHINSLEKEGYLDKFITTKTGGRPGKIYILSNKGIHLFPKQYAWFSELLLKNLKETIGSQGVKEVLNGLGEQVAEQYASRIQGKNLNEMASEIASILNELGYESSLSNEEGAIKASNCVYHDLAIDNPEVCSFDLSLLSALSGHKIEQNECMIRGGHVCNFKIKEKLQGSKKSEYQINCRNRDLANESGETD